MSQFFIATTSGNLPPSVPTSFPTDSGTAIPVANILNIFGNDSTANNANGISTTGVGNTVTVVLSNRITGTITTTNDTPTDLITFLLPSIGVYAFDINVASYNTTDNLGATYGVFVGTRSNGVTATKLNLEDKIVNEEAGNTGCNVSITTSGNSIVIQATGIAGKTINWNAVGTYVLAGP